MQVLQWCRDGQVCPMLKNVGLSNRIPRHYCWVFRWIQISGFWHSDRFISFSRWSTFWVGFVVSRTFSHFSRAPVQMPTTLRRRKTTSIPSSRTWVRIVKCFSATKRKSTPERKVLWHQNYFVKKVKRDPLISPVIFSFCSRATQKWRHANFLPPALGILKSPSPPSGHATAFMNGPLLF